MTWLAAVPPPFDVLGWRDFAVSSILARFTVTRFFLVFGRVCLVNLRERRLRDAKLKSSPTGILDAQKRTRRVWARETARRDQPDSLWGCAMRSTMRAGQA